MEGRGRAGGGPGEGAWAIKETESSSVLCADVLQGEKPLLGEVIREARKTKER